MFSPRLLPRFQVQRLYRQHFPLLGNVRKCHKMSQFGCILVAEDFSHRQWGKVRLKMSQNVPVLSQFGICQINSAAP